jgi:predicted flavoprotein YhiN
MKHVAWYLVVALFIISIVPRVDAGFAPSEIIDLKPEDRAAGIEKIQNVLETKAVSERLSQFGLNKDEITERLSQLSDEQIHQLALQLDDLRVGQDGAGVIIAVLVIIILIIVILQLTGHKIIVTK